MNENTSTRRAVLRMTGSLLALATAECMSRFSGTDADAQTVRIETLRFDPKTTQIAVGTTIVWKNTSQAHHTVTAYEDEIPEGAAYFASGGFDSEQAARKSLKKGLIGPDERYEHTFGRAGRYGYFCIPHEQARMTGTVVVTGAAETKGRRVPEPTTIVH